MNKRIIIMPILIILIIPLLVALLSNLKVFTFAPGDVESWIGFWGSYLGAIISIGGVLYTTTLLIKSEREKNIQILLQNEVKDARDIIVDKSIKELDYINNSIRYLESLMSVWGRFYNNDTPNLPELEFEIYIIMSDWKNDLKNAEYILQIHVEQLQYKFRYLNNKKVKLGNYYIYIVKMFSYLEYGQFFHSEFERINKKIADAKNIKEMKEIVNEHFIAGNGNLVEIYVKWFQVILNEVQNENRKYLNLLY